jgi:hypothetical protein
MRYLSEAKARQQLKPTRTGIDVYQTADPAFQQAVHVVAVGAGGFSFAQALFTWAGLLLRQSAA